MDSVISKKSFPVKDVYDSLEEYRLKHGYTVAEMAEKMGWPYQQYSNMKNRLDKTIKRTTVAKAIKTLGVDFAGLSSIGKQQKILDSYPAEIIEWMATADARRIIATAYVSYKKTAAMALLREEVAGVVEDTYNLNKKENPL